MLNRRDILGLALLTPLLSACGGGGSGSDNGGGNGGGVHEKPVDTDVKADDWPTATPASQGIQTAAMQSLLDESAALPFLYSMLVVRNGQLIGERYANGGAATQMRSVASITKSVSSILIGQAIADGKIASTSDTLAKLLPNELAKTPNTYAAAITLQQLLDMTGGQKWDESIRQTHAVGAPDVTAFALGLPADGFQGKSFNYSTAASHLLSPILRHACGADELALATTRLFEPLGIKNSVWSRDTTGTVHGSFGLQLRTRDLMKLAVMALQSGQWQGNTIVPAAWMTKSLTPTVKGLGKEGAMSDIGYSNLWWSGTMAGLEMHMAAGYGGQYALLVPQLNLAIATAAEKNLPYNAAGAQQVALLNAIGKFLQAAKG